MRPERKEDFPCIICGMVLYREMDDEGQPRDGVVCHTSGNYGSRVFDDLHGEYLTFNICDPCLQDRANADRIFITQGSLPVCVEGSICGAYPVDRPYVAWKTTMEPSDERLNVEISEIIEQTYPRSIRWNGGPEDGWPDVLAGDYLSRHPDEIAEWKEVMPDHVERIDAIMADFQRRMAQRRRR